ncbi:DNA repair protein RAD51 homolog 3-like isoform X1 [Maniola jurtina]|uniref:DNA repair protein RAD51 homolog 3-like isoform X1 n=1 Tax=Maniola jurtina TaxID=191418 RepID=UPI001E68AC20|nr:DNA repair protein RAD51 homolog 3-like isoform X1 [Maniola jurtina]
MSFKMYNATELWQVETSLPSISTFSQSLDKVIGNDGLQLGSLTELLGLPGTGKTQLCLQLCCAIQIPKVLGGLCSEALYIDTNTNFTICRFREILFASLAKCQRLLETSISINEEEALKKLHYVNAFGLEKFCAFLYQLPNFMKSRPNIKIIVIDSIAFPFKEGISLKQRTGLLYRLMADLNKLAVENQIAVVITNEMTTRIGLSSGAIVGALGDAWAHRCNKRLLLSAPDPLDNIRLAVLLKSNNSPETIGKFQITHEGIRDID